MKVLKYILIGLLAITLISCQIDEEEILNANESTNNTASDVIVDENNTNGDATEHQDDVQEEAPMRRAPILQKDFIKAQGKNLYNNYGEGELINLRGVNVGGYMFQEFWMTPTKPSENIHAEIDLYTYLTEEYGLETKNELIALYQDAYFTEDDFDNCADLGMNVLRLPFWYLNIVNEEGELLENWYERFDWFIENAGKRGIYVILDFHGAPGSQNGSDHSGIDGGDQKEEASEFFFGDTSEANQVIYYKIWDAIATRYNNNPVVAGYDLLNEPYCTYRYDSSHSVENLHETLWTIYDEAYKRIRAIDEDHVIIIEATWDPIDLPNPDIYGWENVMYQYHNYLYDDYDNANGQQIKNMEKKLKLIKNANYNVPSYMGEFSYFNNYDAWDEGLKLFSEAGLNWTIWTYKTTQNYGNWGLYHHTSGEANVKVIALESIKRIWGKVGESRGNRRLLEVVEKHFRDKLYLSN